MIGIDEAGRGAWAGPLVVAGCFFAEPPHFAKKLNDSKKLTRNKRRSLEKKIKASGVYSIVVIGADEIDRLGLTKVIKKAILKILKDMPQDEVIQLDGTYNFLKDTVFLNRTKVEAKADGRYVEVMAASILAKVERDRILNKLNTDYPGYEFASNVGYGTAAHSKALKIKGPSSVHRMTFKPLKDLR